MATVLTDSGRSRIANRIQDLLNTPAYLAVGTGAGTAGVTDTTLFSETGTRVPVNFSLATISVADDTLVATAVWVNAGLAVTLTNTGLFDAMTAGTLFCKADGIGWTLDPGDGLTVVWRIQIL